MCSTPGLPTPGASLVLRVSFVDVQPAVIPVQLWGLVGERRDEYKGLKNQMTDLPNYNFADGPVKTTLTFTPRSFQNRATVLSPTGMDFLLFQHLRQPYSWPGFESAKP